MLKLDNVGISFAYGGPPPTLKHASIFFVSDDDQKIIYLTGRQIIIEKVPSCSDIGSTQAKSKYEFIQFGELVSRSLMKHTGYKYKDFCFDRISQKGFINVKISDEKSKCFPKIIVFDLNENKNTKIEFSDLKKDSFCSVRFAPNSFGKFFIALSKVTPQSVVFYDLTIMRLLGMITLSKDEQWEEVYNCPADGFLCLLTSKKKKEIGLVRINDNISVKEINLRYSLKTGVGFIEWITDDVFAVSDTSAFSIALVLYQKKVKFTVIQKIESIKCAGLPDDIVGNSNIQAMKKYSKGLIVATSMALLLVFVQKTEFSQETKISHDNNFLALQNCIKLTNVDNLMIQAIDFTSNESTMLLVFAQNSYFKVSTEGLIKQASQDVQSKKNYNPKVLECDLTYQVKRNYVSSSIGVTTGDYSSNVISLSENQYTLDVINPYSDANNFQYQFEIQTDNSQIIACELHPNGYLIICSLKDRLNSYNLVFKNLVPIAENIRVRNAYIMRFCEGGSILACSLMNYKSNLHPICLVNPYSLDIIKMVNTHSHTNTIFDLLFSDLATSLWSGSVDGYLFMWAIPSMKKTEIFIEKEYKFRAMDLVQSPSTQLEEPVQYINLLCEDQKGLQYIIVQYIEKTDKRQFLKLTNANEQGVAIKHTSIKSVYIPDRCYGLLVGNNLGSVYFFANANNFGTASFVIQTSCSLEISRIFFSLYNLTITVYSKEGQINIFSLKFSQEVLKEVAGYTICEEERKHRDEQGLILIDHTEIAKYEQKEKNLLLEMQDIVSKFDFKANEEKLQFEEASSLLKIQFEEEMKKRNDEIDQLKKLNAHLEKETSSMLKTIEHQNLTAVEELEKLYEVKVQTEGEKLIQQDKMNRIEIEKLQEKLSSLSSKQKTSLEKTEESYKNQLQSATSKLQGIEQDIQTLNQKHENKILSLQAEHDSIVIQIKEKYVAKVKKGEEEMKVLNSDVKKFKRFNDEVTLLNVNLQNQSDLAEEKVKIAEEKIRDLERSLKKAIDDNAELREVITEKDKTFYRFKKTIDELEKTKNVLTFRTAEMRKGMEPKEIQIDRLKDEVVRLENELEMVLKKNSEKDTLITKKNDEIKSALANIQKLHIQISDKEFWIKHISGVITNCVQRTEPKMWHIQMKKIYHFVLESSRLEDGGVKSPAFQKETVVQIDEMTTQIHHLQTKINQQNKMKIKSTSYQMKHIENKTEENATLLSELNDLRISYKKLNSIKTSLSIANGQLMRENKYLHNELRKFEVVSQKNQNVQQQEIDQNKENRSQTLPNFKIRTLNPSKIDNTSVILQELIETEENKNKIFQKMTDEEKNGVLNKLVEMIPKNKKEKSFFK